MCYGFSFPGGSLKGVHCSKNGDPKEKMYRRRLPFNGQINLEYSLPFSLGDNPTNICTDMTKIRSLLN